MSDNGGWAEGVALKCEAEGCDYITGSGKEAMTHAYETGHSLTGSGAIEGTTLTVSLVREDEEEDAQEDPMVRQAQAFAMLRDAAEVPPTEELS